MLVAALAILGGGVFFLQGIGLLPGSFMTGDPSWAWIGGGMLLGGIGLGWWTLRSGRG
jgi:hypothetical protein